MKTSNVLIAVAAGMAAGALAGILFAPDKGSETRRKIVDTGVNLKNNVKDKVNGVVDKVSDTYNSMKERMTHQEDGVEKTMKA